MVDDVPILPPTAAKARAQDIELIEADARRALTADRPASDALWAALLKPRDVVLREYAETRARLGTMATSPLMVDLMTPEGRAMGEGPSALHAMANTLVARAIIGEESAANLVMTRIEGVPAKRKGDEDTDKERAGLLASIGTLVEKMYEQAARRPGDSAKDITNGSANGHDKD